MKEFDLLVVGGGVNGCGIARDAAKRGLKVMLVEKGDISAGTTWGSSGMIHGGIRYLFSDVGVTKLACIDSGYIQKIAPHMIFRIPFIFVLPNHTSWVHRFIIYEGASAVFETYDNFAKYKGGKPACRLTPAEVRKLEPLIREDIHGGISMDEWGIDCPRLCLANAKDAELNGAEVRTHTRLVSFIKDGSRIVGAELRNEVSGETEEVKARIVFNATGPWVPQLAALAGCEVKLRPAKGVHLVLDRRLTDYGVLCTAIDGRQMFVMPHENVSYIGTTDDDYYGDPGDIPVLEDEIAYLLQAAESYIPDVRKARVIKVLRAVRPTLFETGKYEDDLTREHQIFDHEERDGIPGFITMGGGKLASYRVMSEEAVDLVMLKLGKVNPCRSHLDPLPGGDTTPSAEALAAEFGIDPYAASRVIYRHGSWAARVLESIKTNPGDAYVVDRYEPTLAAEIRYCVRNEWVKRPSDLIRRCRVGEGADQGMASIQQATQIFAEENKLGPRETIEAADDFLQAKWFERHEALSGVGVAQEELSRMINLGCWRTAQRSRIERRLP